MKLKRSSYHVSLVEMGGPMIICDFLETMILIQRGLKLLKFFKILQIQEFKPFSKPTNLQTPT